MTSSLHALMLAGLLASPLRPTDSSLARSPRYASVGGVLTRSKESRVVNGIAAKAGDAPWQVAILVRIPDTDQFELCGGSAIARKWVLTAAHCVADVALDRVEVRSGSVNLDDASARRAVPSRILVHQDWNRITYDNDVALIEVELATDAVPVSMIKGDGDVVAAKHMMISGFGRVSEFSATSNVLLLAHVNFISYESCNDRQSYDGQVHPMTMFCADAPFDEFATSDACKGDSGGPITRERDGKVEQVGIISWGNGCGDPSFPGIYVRLSQYRAWIDERAHRDT